MSAIAALRRQRIVEDLMVERGRQEALLAEGRFAFTCADEDIYDHTKLAVLVEEVGEVSRVLCDSFNNDELDLYSLRRELVQVAAVAVAWIEAVDAQPTAEEVGKPLGSAEESA